MGSRGWGIGCGDALVDSMVVFDGVVWFEKNLLGVIEIVANYGIGPN